MRHLNYCMTTQGNFCAIHYQNPRERDGILAYLTKEGYSWVLGKPLIENDRKTAAYPVGYIIFSDKSESYKIISYADNSWLLAKTYPEMIMTTKFFFKNYGKDVYGDLFRTLDKLEDKHEKD